MRRFSGEPGDFDFVLGIFRLHSLYYEILARNYLKYVESSAKIIALVLHILMDITLPDKSIVKVDKKS